MENQEAMSELEERLTGRRCPYPGCGFKPDSSSEEDSSGSEDSGGSENSSKSERLLSGQYQAKPPSMQTKESEGEAEPKRRAAVCPGCKRPFTRRSQIHGQEMVKKVRQYKRSSAEQSAGAKNGIETRKEAGNLADLVVVLEDLRSLHNVGAIFRTADGAGFGKVICCGITAVPPRPQIAKVSLGAEDYVAYQFYPLITEALALLKAQGYTIVALEKNQDSRSLFEALQTGSIKTPLALVLGNEVAGVSAEALYLSDAVCHLSMRGLKESLNVSVAFGAASYLIAEMLSISEK